jgi:hypothetical protein
MFTFANMFGNRGPSRRKSVAKERVRAHMGIEQLEDRLAPTVASIMPSPVHILWPPLKNSDPIQAKYQSLGGAGGFLGYAVTGEQATPYGGGTYEQFQGGNIYWSQPTKAHVVYGCILGEYLATASETDAYGNVVQQLLGLPTSDEMDVPGIAGARMNTFQGGMIEWSPDTGAHVVYGGIWGEYQATANEQDAYGTVVQTILGLPTIDEGDVPGVSGGRVTQFQGGSIYWSANTGAHVVYGGIWGDYQATANEQDFYGRDVQILLGLPTSDEAHASGARGGRVTQFQGGSIYWSATTGAHVIYGGIGRLYNDLGGAAALGLPTTDEATTPDGAGRFEHFETTGPNGGAVAAIDWTPKYGANAVTGAIAAEFASIGWEASGEAVTGEIDIASLTYFGAYNRFWSARWQPFAIDYTSTDGASVVAAPSYSDIIQGSSDTCWIDASIAELVQSGVDLSGLIHYQGNNTYTVSLHNFNDSNNRQGGGMHADSVTVYFNSQTYGADLSWNSADPAQSWALIMQRAVIEAVSEWDPSQSIQNPHSGDAADALSILTGKATSWFTVRTSNIEQWVLSALASDQPVVLGTLGSGTHFLVARHVYAVISASDSFISLYNPLGSPVTVSWSVIFQDGSGFAFNG